MKKCLYGVLFAAAVCQLAHAQEAQNVEPQQAVQDQNEQSQQVAVQPQEQNVPPVEAPQKAEVVQAQPEQQPVVQQVAVNIGLNKKIRKEVVGALKVLLADEFVLYTKTLKFHWNVRGPHFGPLHELFGKQYAMLQEFFDSIAERIRAFGYMAPGTVAEFNNLASLQEQVGDNPNDLDMIAELLDDHEAIIQSLRHSIDLTAKLNDMGTNNFLADLITKHEKIAWMLRAHLEQ